MTQKMRCIPASNLLFDESWEITWGALSDQQKAAWREIAYISNIDSESGPCVPVALFHWDALSPGQRRNACIQHDFQNDPEHEGERVIGWHDATLDAATWFALQSVSPGEAAALLCRFNPHDDGCNPSEDSTDETEPSDFNRLKRVFEDIATDLQPRNLLEWFGAAKNKGLKHHSWINNYIAAISAISLKDTATSISAPHPYGCGKHEIIEGFQLVGKNWEDILGHPKKDGKRFLDALLQPGRRGRGASGTSNSALWNPVVFARLLITHKELNRGQVMARFKNKWSHLEDELISEIGEMNI